MVLTNIKTPGVYVEEVSLFPPSVAQVATAVPAFIGYTETARDPDGNSLANKAIRITSLLDFITFFGKGYEATGFKALITANKEIKSVDPNKRYYMFDALRQFFDNGGSDCYIISVGSYNDEFKASKFSDGLDELKKYDEPTLILFPDACALLSGNAADIAAIADLQKKSLALCASMQDRFSILDVADGDRPSTPLFNPVQNFRDNIGVNFLSYGAAYYPWVVTNYDINFNFRLLSIAKEAAPNVALSFAALADYNKDDNEEALLDAYELRKSVTDQFIEKLFPGNPNAANRAKFTSKGAEFLKEETVRLENILLESAGASHKDKLKDYLDFMAKLVNAFPLLAKDLAADQPKLNIVNAYKQDKTFLNTIILLIAFEKDPTVIDNTGRTAADVDGSVYKEALDGWTNGVLFGAIDLTTIDAAIDKTKFTNNKEGSIEVLKKIKEKIVGSVLGAYENLFYMETQADKALFTQHSFFKGVGDKLRERMRTIPPSGTIAGIYSMIDGTRGVWKAPANVSINSTLGPAVKIDNKQQEELNVHTTGKSVNAIRSFTGKGTLVWGARTLAGNDNEWRYVPVRRFFIMVEESTKKATEPFVFENNDANTWIRVKVMIENFLTLQWRAGALQGAKPEDAFFVKVGLNETMTEDDLLNGRMIIEIGMAVVRPAEFIILRFSHKMMEK